MKRALIRSSIFNVLFYVLTGISCVLCLPTLVLPRRFFMGIVHFFVHMVHFLERTVLGLRYEVRGLENLPKDGSYIVAAKHQSAYETMKLHILFQDPAVILKKQLLSIPLWGLYLKKSDPIAIDRSTPDTAIASIQSGAQRMKEQGRPIVIFPQGTRVRPDQTTQDKPYKVGIARIQEATDLPIIPMAINAGLFWPRHGWFKSPGCVIFEFLEPIPAGMERQNLMAKLEKETEEATQSLMNEAKEKEMDAQSSIKSLGIGVLAILTLLFGTYSLFWFTVADQIQKEYPLALAELTETGTVVQEPEVTGYPGKIKLHVTKETLQTDDGSVIVEDLRAQGWPIPAAPITVTTGPIAVRNFKWKEPLRFDSLYAVLKYDQDILRVYESALKQEDFTASVAGTADLTQEPVPALDLNIKLSNHQTLLGSLAKNGIVEDRMALFMGAGLSSLANESGDVELPVHQKGQVVYAGPLPIMTIPPEKPQTRRNAITPPPEAPLVEPTQDLETLPAPSR